MPLAQERTIPGRLAFPVLTIGDDDTTLFIIGAAAGRHGWRFHRRGRRSIGPDRVSR